MAGAANLKREYLPVALLDVPEELGLGRSFDCFGSHAAVFPFLKHRHGKCDIREVEVFAHLDDELTTATEPDFLPACASWGNEGDATEGGRADGLHDGTTIGEFQASRFGFFGIVLGHSEDGL